MKGNGADSMGNEKIIEAAQKIVELLKKEKFSEGKELTKSAEVKLDEIIESYISKGEE